jgi:hypothetical protein
MPDMNRKSEQNNMCKVSDMFHELSKPHRLNPPRAELHKDGAELTMSDSTRVLTERRNVPVRRHSHNVSRSSNHELLHGSIDTL